MAFKNIFTPNQATGGRFSKNLSEIIAFNNDSEITYTTTPNGMGGTKCTTNGQSWTGIGMHLSNLSTSSPASSTIEIYNIDLPSLRSYLGEYPEYTEFSLSAGLNTLKLENIIPTSQAVYLITENAGTFYYIEGQVESGSTATSWEFPGLDLTGNSIASQEAVQNLKLNQQLKLFTIASGEQINNLTVENILQLLQVPSSEYVNNLEICNSIFLEAIESTETVNELIVWIACEFMKCNITMKTPKTILKMKYPR